MSTARRLLRSCPASLLLLVLLATGCVRVHVPKLLPRPGGKAHELNEHVEFLTQPDLNGRKCRSIESWYVRQYLRQQFEVCGLVPWGRASGLDESFGFGSNVVGVLRGADPRVADEVVLVAAHYDGLGVQNGKVYPGAASDAAGVAILLQLAERLSAERHKLRRSVALAAFDCGEERYFGAFAFTLRKDFDPSKLAGVIDLDLLGRNNFGIIENTLIVVGTDGFPYILRAVEAAAARTASAAAAAAAATGTTPASRAASQRAANGPLRIMPAGSDLIPPISDYFAFEQWPVPVLLLTNGLYFDYHKPTDTADKLHYGLLQRDADVVLDTVRDLANREKLPPRVPPAHGDRQELRAILTTLDQALAHARQLDLTPLERQRLGHLAAKARQLLAQSEYTLADRKAFIEELAVMGAPSILRFFYAPPKPDPARILGARRMAQALTWYEMLASHRAFVSHATQQVVRHFVEGRGNLLRLLWSYTYSSCDIHRDEISLRKEQADPYRLSFIYPHLRITAGIFTRDVKVQYEAGDCRGSIGQIVDYCLLYWSLGEETCMSRVMPAVLAAVTGRDEGPRYEDWLAWRMHEVGADDEAVWEYRLWQGRNGDVLKLLLKEAAGHRRPDIPQDALREIITDGGMRADVRADAIAAVDAGAGKDLLLALADTLGDTTPVQPRRYLPAFDPTFPFYAHVAMREVRLTSPPRPATTVGAAAYGRLKVLTGQDFPAEPGPWREWLERRG
jgi:hypothetical protein